VVFGAVGLGMLISLVGRDRLALNVLHDRNPQFVMESNGDIRNGYTIRILNMIAEPRSVKLSVAGLSDAVMKINALNVEDAQSVELIAEPDQASSFKVFVKRPKQAVTSTEESFYFIVSDASGGETASYEATFKGPEVKK